MESTFNKAREFIGRWDRYTKAVYGDDVVLSDVDFTDSCNAVFQQMQIDTDLTVNEKALIINMARRVYDMAQEEYKNEHR